MIPENRESTTPVRGTFIAPDGMSGSQMIDYERGGIAVNDPSQGLRVQEWMFYYRDGVVYCKADLTAEFAIFAADGVTALSGSFDQNMRPIVAYLIGKECRLNWYDTLAGTRRDDSFGELRTPKLSLDDKRSSQFQASDVIFSYIRDGNLCYRQQRDRYTVERILRSGLSEYAKIISVGMTHGWRLQFEIR